MATNENMLFIVTNCNEVLDEYNPSVLINEIDPLMFLSEAIQIIQKNTQGNTHLLIEFNLTHNNKTLTLSNYKIEYDASLYLFRFFRKLEMIKSILNVHGMTLTVQIIGNGWDSWRMPDGYEWLQIN